MTGKDIENYLVQLGIPSPDAKILAATAYGESGYNAQAVLKTSQEYSVGLFQINMYAHGELLRQLTGSNDIAYWEKWLKNPLNNIRAAVEVYKRRKAGPTKSGLTAWTVFTKGTWKAYLPKYETTSVKNIPADTSTYVPDANVLSPGHTPKWKQVWDDFLIKLGLKNDFPEQPTPEEELKARKYEIEEAKKKGEPIPQEFMDYTQNLEAYVASQQDKGIKGTLNKILFIIIGIACFIVGAFFLTKDFAGDFVLGKLKAITAKEG